MGDPHKAEHVRCPYCVEESQFKIMILQVGGDWYLCSNCGHLALPANPLFHCTCSKCAELEQADATWKR
jgi:hypothetical protein